MRRAATGDLDGLLGLVQEYWQFEGIGGFDEARVGAQVMRLLSDPRLGAAWIALDDDGPAGYLLAVYVFSLEHLGLTAEIDELYVRPRCRGSGVGAGILRLAEAEFRSAGCTNVSLQVGCDNDGGRRFYFRHGYAARSGFEILDKML